MLTAHAAAGYVVAKLFTHLKPQQLSNRCWAMFGLTSGLLPDIDMLYFYWVDLGKVHHHRYISHWPIFWLVWLIISYFYWRKRPQQTYAALALLLGINGCIHLFLDTLVGDIWLFMPWIDKSFAFFTVPALYKPWYWNFILHWSFTFEISVWLLAIFMFFRTTKTKYAA